MSRQALASTRAREPRLGGAHIPAACVPPTPTAARPRPPGVLHPPLQSPCRPGPGPGVAPGREVTRRDGGDTAGFESCRTAAVPFALTPGPCLWWQNRQL